MEVPSLVQALAPLVAVLSSPAVNQICRSNGLEDFVELLRPFQHDIQRIPIRTTQLTTITAPTFPLRLCSLQSLESLPLGSSFDRSDLVLDTLSASISAKSSQWDDEIPHLKIDGTSQDQANDVFKDKNGRPKREDVERVTPWYSVFKNILLGTRPMGEYETFQHPVCMLLAISTNDKDPMNTLGAMFDHSNASKLYLHRQFMDPTVLKYFVVVHDVGGGGSIEESEKLVSQIKKTYGPHVSLLPVSSLSPSSPPSPFLHQVYSSLPPLDPLKAFTQAAKSPVISQEENEEAIMLGGMMTEVDVTRIKAFLKEFVGGSLVPFMERCVADWNETYASSRRGLTGRLFGAGRKFFGGGSISATPTRPSSPSGSTNGYNVAKGIYPYVSPDAVSRKLADFAFMLRDYKFASGVYDSIRKDFGTDKAWRYQAGATEMYGLTLLLLYPPNSRPTHPDVFLQQSTQTYALRQTLQLDSIRTTLLYYETYMFLGEYTQIVPALMRAAGEDQEVSSAILIEQAALADLMGSGKARLRRYAGHMVMAASRYEKSGQKSFSRRCLEQAVVLYRNQAWTKAQDHVEHSLGRQAYSQGQSEIAVDHFVRLMKGKQEGALEDFVLAFKHLQASHPEKITQFSDKLPEPIFQKDSTGLRLLGRESTLSSSPAEWSRLESTFLERGFVGGARKKPEKLLNLGEHNIVTVGESFYLELVAKNPLDAQLKLGDITVETTSLDGKPSGDLDVEIVSEVVLEPRETRTIPIKVTPFAIQKLTFAHATFRFHDLLPCRQSLLRKGKRLNITRAQRLTPTYSPDTSLTVTVEPPRPNLEVNLEELPLALGEGESVLVTVELVNKGDVGLKDLRMMISEDCMLRVIEVATSSAPYVYPIVASSIIEKLPLLDLPNDLSPSFPTSIKLPNDSLAPGETMSASMLCHGRSVGFHDLLLLFAYQSLDNPNRYFSSTATHTLRVDPVIDVFASHSKSKSSPINQLLSIDIESHASEPLKISQVCVLSALWEASYPKGWSPEPDEILSATQSLHYNLWLNPNPSDQSSRSSTAFTSRKLQQLLAGSLDLSSTPPSTALRQSPAVTHSAIDTSHPTLLSLLLSSLCEARLVSLRAQYPLIPPSNLPFIFSLFEPTDLSIIVFWEIPSQARRGHTIVSTLSPGPSESIFLGSDDKEGEGRVVRSMFEATDNAKRALMASVFEGPLALEEDPVVVEVKIAQEFVQHDFHHNPCRIPTVIQLLNTSINLACRIKLELSNSPLSPTYSSGFYTADLSHTVILQPASIVSLPATFWAPRPGVYNLASWRLSVETGEASAAEGEWVRTRKSFSQDAVDRPAEVIFVSEKGEAEKEGEVARLVGVVA